MQQDDLAISDNPYVGPRTFQLGESHLFFGRDREARDLQSLVISRRLVLFYAQSGAGKSSLVNTRLIPGLEKKNFEVLPVARIGAEMQPDADVTNIYVNNLLLSIDPALTHQDVADTTLSHFLDHLILSDGRYFYDEEYLYPEDYEIKPRVLIIDQFEELFTAYPEAWRAQAGFFKQLNKAMRVDEELWVVLVMREDYIAKLDPYTHLLSGGLHHRYYMQPMAESAALKAIKEPAKKAGRPFEESAAIRLVNDLRQVRSQTIDQGASFVEGQFVEPVQLQVVCYQLWEELRHADGRKIDNDDLDRMTANGDLAHFVNNALAQFYEDSIAEVLESPTTTVCEPELRDWFSQKLITEAKTRGIVYQGEEKSGGLENAAARILENHYLIRAVTRAGGRWLELVHDRFIDPILEANDTWLHDNPLVMASRNWEKSGRGEEHLFLARQLAEALRMPNRDQLGPLVTEFLEKSQAAERAHQAERERRERELEARRQQAEKRAEEQADFAATLRRQQRVLIAALVVAIGLAIVASIFARQSTKNAQLAEENEILAAKRADEAEENAMIAATSEAVVAEYAASEVTRAAEVQEAIILAATREAETLRMSAELDEARLEADYNAKEATRAEESAKLIPARLLANGSRALLDDNPQLAILLALASEEGLNPEVEDVAQFMTNEVEPILASAPYVYPPLEATLSGHPARVLALAWSPDGTRLASGSADQTIVIWDVTSRQPIAKLVGHRDWVRDLDWSPDGTRLASASYDLTVRIWDVADLQAADQAPDAVSIVDDAIVLEGHSDWVRTVSWSPDGTRLASGADDRYIAIWDLRGEEIEVTPLEGHTSAVRGVTWSPDGAALASASEDGTVRIWDVESGETVQRLDSHADGVLDIAWSPDGRLLASAGRDSAVIIWDVQDDWAETRLQEHSDIVWSVSWSPDSRRLASGSVDRNIIIWDVDAAQSIARYQGHSDHVLSIAWSPGDGRLLASAGRDNTVVLWDTAARPASDFIEGLEGEQINSMAWSPDGSRLAYGIRAGSVVLIDMATGERRSLEGHVGRVVSLAWSPDGRRLASGSLDKTIIVWDANSGRPISQLEGHDDQVRAVSWSADGQQLATASDDGTVLIWDLTTVQPIVSLPDHQGIIWSAAWSPDGARLATGSGNGTIALWDPASGQPLGSARHDGAVRDLAWSPDGAKLASASEDGTVRIWDAASLSAADMSAPVVELQARAGLRGTAWSPDGRQLAAAADDGLVWVWDADSGQPLAQLLGAFGTRHQGFPAQALDVAWSPDGTWLTSLLLSVQSNETYLRLLNTRYVRESCQLVSRNPLYSGEWADYLPGQLYRPICPNHPVLPNVLIDAAQGQAVDGDVDGAVSLYEWALEIQPGIIQLDPALEAKLIRVTSGDPSPEDVEAAIAAFQTGGLDRARAGSPGFLNALCWEGSLAGYAEDVLPACNEASDLAPTNYAIRDSRAVARALTGDLAGAIEDFNYVLPRMEEFNESPAVISKRLDWLADLEAGINPFDAATLEYLKESE